MPWAKVDDGWWCHPKVMALSPSARGVWISVLSWSCQQRSPKVPPHLLAMVGGSNAEANALASAGLWEQEADGWVIHDWADYQDRSLSEKRADAGRKGGQASGRTRRERSNDEATDEQEPKQVPDPTRPDPTDTPPAPPFLDQTLEEITDRIVMDMDAAGTIRTSPERLRPSVYAAARTDHAERVHALHREHPEWGVKQVADCVLRKTVPLEASRHAAVLSDKARREREALDDAPVADAEVVADAAARARAELAARGVA